MKYYTTIHSKEYGGSFIEGIDERTNEFILTLFYSKARVFSLEEIQDVIKIWMIHNYKSSITIHTYLWGKMRVYDIGYQDIEFFWDLEKILKKYNIKYLVDVRLNPISYKKPHFNKTSLENSMANYANKQDVTEYIFAGERLGNPYHHEKYWANMYESHIRNNDKFNEAIDKLIELGQEGDILLFCAEKDFKKCHRKYVEYALQDKCKELKIPCYVMHLDEAGR